MIEGVTATKCPSYGRVEKEMHVSVALAEFQSFLFIAIISGAAGRRRPTY
jgi:hypothetical protein